MKYLCLEYGEESKVREIEDRERLESVIRLEASAHLLSATLESVATATTVRVRGGRLSIADGPFAATREQLVGFHLIEARQLEEAVQIAAAIPTAKVGCVEVRAIRSDQPLSPPAQAAAESGSAACRPPRERMSADGETRPPQAGRKLVPRP